MPGVGQQNSKDETRVLMLNSQALSLTVEIKWRQPFWGQGRGLS